MQRKQRLPNQLWTAPPYITVVDTNSDKSDTSMKQQSQNRLKLVKKIGDWWKRRQFYFAHEPDAELSLEAQQTRTVHNDEGGASNNRKKFQRILPSDEAMRMKRELFPELCRTDSVSEEDWSAMADSDPTTTMDTVMLDCPIGMGRSKTTESLVSFDSQTESMWGDPDADETTSQDTPVATNKLRQISDFFEAHIAFLRSNTEPQTRHQEWTNRPPTQHFS
jgi:hypothetical protein